MEKCLADICDTIETNEVQASTTQGCVVDEITAVRLAETFKALSDPTRVRIISALFGHEMCVHELAQAIGMSQSAISHQLRTLREMRLVRFRQEGRHVYYIIDDDHIRDLFCRGLEHISHD
jgi:ArsR family transcriptional regulator